MKRLVVGVLAHVDSGKTTLSEALLYRAGSIRKLGRVDHRDAFLDTDALEKARGITIFAKQAVLTLPAGTVTGTPLEETQITLLDTPGHVDFTYEVSRSLAACEGAVLVVDASQGVEAQTLANTYLALEHDLEILPVINKIDLSDPARLDALVEKWQAELPAARIVPVSAREQFNLEGLFQTILELLPEGPAYYPKDTLTDKTLRFFASEIIREKILKFYDKEIPYCCEIEIESYKEEPAIDRIAATIYVARDSQKGILIGHKGEKLKRVGQAAREDMEQFLGKKVFLQLFVKVSEDWRNNERQLRRFGYEQE